MASTSTNKQPLFIDRVLHYVKNLDDKTNNGQDVKGANTAELIVDSTSADGAILEDIYLISRSDAATYKVNLYLSNARDYLRTTSQNTETAFVGSITSVDSIGAITEWVSMPKVLAPVPHVSDSNSTQQNRAFYVPKGYALWAARDDDANVSDGPLLGCQGGWY